MGTDVPIEITRYGGEGFRPAGVRTIKEIPLRIFLGGRELVCLLCSGTHPRFLTAGYLFSCGLIAAAADIAELDVAADETGMTAHVALRGGVPDLCGLHVTSGLGRLVNANGPRTGKVLPVNAPWVDPDSLLSLMGELHARSALYRLTRGCHNAALCTAGEMLFFRSDIGRHNAIDAIVGQCLLEGTALADKMILTTGRAASEIVHKAAHAGVPVLASTAVATSLAVESARERRLTLVGNVTRDGFWIYSTPGRFLDFR